MFFYLQFVDGDRYLSVDFGNSSNEAVLKFYPAVAEESSVSPACLRFNVYISSPAVELLTAVLDVANDSKDVNYHQQVHTGEQSVMVQHTEYVVFIAKKVKVTRIPDRLEIRNISFADGPCKNDAVRK